jgi:hypothetical protein
VSELSQIDVDLAAKQLLESKNATLIKLTNDNSTPTTSTTAGSTLGRIDNPSANHGR